MLRCWLSAFRTGLWSFFTATAPPSIQIWCGAGLVWGSDHQFYAQKNFSLHRRRPCCSDGLRNGCTSAAGKTAIQCQMLFGGSTHASAIADLDLFSGSPMVPHWTNAARKCGRLTWAPCVTYQLKSKPVLCLSNTACKAVHVFLMKNYCSNLDGRLQNPEENPGKYIQNWNRLEDLHQFPI